MATAAVTEQAYPASGESYYVEILRVYLSGGDDPEAAAHAVAAKLEVVADVLGSTILPSIGRWRGGAEPGYVLELAYRPSDDKNEQLAFALQELRETLDLTFFVTRQTAEAMEVYA